MNYSEFSMIVLAGGASRRMGSDKARFIWEGKTFLEIQIEKGEALGIKDILVSGYRGEDCRYPVIMDRYPGRGPLAGIEACMRKARGRACLVLCVDAPLVPVEELRNLLETYRSSDKQGVILKSGDREQSLIAVYDVALAEAMEEEILYHKGSAFALMNRLTYDNYVSQADSDVFANINDRESFRRYCLKEDIPDRKE